MKKKLLVSFSGGETSAYMSQWLWTHKQDEYDMVFVFANTGEENEETLEFVKKCSEHFNFKVYWVEAKVHHGKKKGSTHKVVDFNTASRKGEPFEDVIKKYGIPNQAFPHCTRELKLNPITSFTKEYFGKKYYTAIGIRSDEADRINSKARERRLIYPLISEIPMTKPNINFWWSQQPFRLDLKGYQGNCKTCWKKSDPKLYQIAKESPEFFKFMDEMETKYPRIGPEFQKDKSCTDRTFFRKNRTAKQILKESKSFHKKVKDDSVPVNNSIQTDLFQDLVGGDSCEVWSSCGD